MLVNAGVELRGVDIAHTTREQWDRVLGVNLTGCFLGIRAAAPFAARGRAAVDRQYRIDRRHQRAFRGRLQRVEMGPARADQGGGHGICRLEHPGERRASEHSGDCDDGGLGTSFVKAMVSVTPLGRGASVEDVAHAVMFLASDEAGYLTGLDLPVDGGFISTLTIYSRHENRLAQATSPYLLQHKHNPVDWWQWGPDALAEAKRSNRPIMLSVGYAACHWCHVMAHESFEDEATAQVMNELFVNIKVDREERPDIDQIYMNALHLLGEQGGWPLTMFLTPEAEPVWGGTYFPKESKFGRPAFTDILREVSRMFREEPNKIEQNRAALLARLADKARPAGKGDDRAQGARRRRGPARQHVRFRPWRPARRAQVSAAGDSGNALARGRTQRRRALFRDGRAFARSHERGRHLRSPRRRLLALFGG